MSFRINFKKARVFILILLVIGFSFSGGYYLGVQGFRANITRALEVSISRQVPPGKNIDFSLFWQVWDTLSSKYYDKTMLDPNKMVYGAISGMVSSLGDPYTMFLPPDQNKKINEDLSGSFSGVGIQLGLDKAGQLIVEAPLPSSPAEKAGVKAGDFIAHIKDIKKNIDIDTPGITTTNAVTYIRGPVGTTVTLTLVREGEDAPLKVDLVRAKLDVPSVSLTFEGDNKQIANIKVNSFNAQTPTEWNKKVDEILLQKEIKGIIVDLRNNPGGYLQDSVDLTSDFVKIGSTVVISADANGGKINYKTKKTGRLLNLPVVVLVNGGSASASEIMAGALKDLINAKTIGTKSFGKGTIQEPIDITDGAGIHITVAKWLTPNGTWVHGTGITPDIVIDNVVATEDAQLKAAIELFK
jgi:carboxyl-terminal processing protease